MNPLDDIRADIRRADAAIRAVSATTKRLLADKSVPLKDRWDLFKSLPDSVAVTGMDHETIPLIDGFEMMERPFYHSRYETVDVADSIENLAKTLAENPEWGDGHTLDEYKEAALQRGWRYAVWDW